MTKQNKNITQKTNRVISPQKPTRYFDWYEYCLAKAMGYDVIYIGPPINEN